MSMVMVIMVMVIMVVVMMIMVMVIMVMAIMVMATMVMVIMAVMIIMVMVIMVMLIVAVVMVIMVMMIMVMVMVIMVMSIMVMVITERQWSSRGRDGAIKRRRRLISFISSSQAQHSSNLMVFPHVQSVSKTLYSVLEVLLVLIARRNIGGMSSGCSAGTTLFTVPYIMFKSLLESLTGLEPPGDVTSLLC